MHEYREYLEAKYLDEFDEWAKSYVNPFTDLRGEYRVPQLGLAKRARRSSRTTASSREVLFPNTIPPFFPSRQPRRAPARERPRTTSCAGPGSRRTTGGWPTSAPTRPGRRAGMAQIFLNDIDDAVAEIQLGARARPLRRDPAAGRAARLGAAAADRARLRADLGRCAKSSTCRSTTTPAQPGPDFGELPGVDGDLHDRARLVLAPRVLAHGVRRRVRARHPGLKLVLTEQSAGWVPGVLAMLDHQYSRFLRRRARRRRTSAASSVKKMTQSPSEYWDAQLLTRARASSARARCTLRYEIGVDTIMWGQDYPHVEGTYPYTTEALRNTFAGVADRRGRADGRRHRRRRVRLRPRRARARRRAGRPDRRQRSRSARPRARPTRVSIAFAEQELKPW